MASTSTCARRPRTPPLLLLAAALAAGPAAGAAAQDGVAADRAALEALYVATGGPEWTDDSNWRTSAPLDEWFGVSTDRAGRVTWLNLSGNGLTGPIPAAVGDLDRLQALYLGWRWDSASRELVENALTGPIPPALGRLANLERLVLDGNALTGPVPAELGDLTGLRQLLLHSNALAGPIPPALGRLSHLERLDLGFNALAGPIPAELRNLTNLESLFLAGNALSGPVPAWLGDLTGLETLSLGGNALAGPIPPALGRLSHLERLGLGQNALTGSIPAGLGDLTGLRSLELFSNELSGPIPGELGNLSNLERLSAGRNALTGPLPAGLGDLAALQRLYLGSNGLSGPVPSEMGNLANLEHLFLESNPLTGSLPRSLTRLSALTRLDVSLTGACAPADPAFQAWLATIAFRGDTCNRPPEPVGAIPPQALTESGPAVGVPLEPWFTDPDGDALTYSAASGSAGTVAAFVSGGTVWLAPGSAGAATVTVTASDADGLSATQPVAVTVGASAGPQSGREVLEIFYDSTGGPGWTNRGGWKTSAPPGDWHGVTTDADGRVTELALRDNGLTGVIPPALGDLDSLTTVDLGFNALTGPIPRELGRLRNLEELSLRANDLTGPVPPSLGNLTRLRWLLLGYNALTGPIPRELGNLVDLVWLSLGGNDLTGPVPAWLGNLTRLRSLGLGFNGLTGPLPRELGRLADLGRLSLDGNDLTGPVADVLGGLANLVRLTLSHNWGLSGPLPPVARFPRLESADVLVTGVCAPAGWLDGAAGIELYGRPCETGAEVTIDVAVVHTPAAREAAGGAAGIAAVIDLMVAETNQAYADSGVRHRVRLVGRSEVAYAETGVSAVDLRRLADPSDGHMDAVHALRDRVGADLVHLIVDESDVGGRASILRAFGLSRQSAGGRTFAHELGHNLGLQHDRYQVHHHEGGVRPHPAYGYLNQPALVAGAARHRRWRTIMAYGTQCGDAYTYCALPLRFSNPRQTWDGDPLGVAHGIGASGVTGPADAAAVLDATGPAAARWRDRPAGANRPPAAAGALPDRALTLPGVLAVDVSAAFADPDGDPLTYAVSSSAPEVATVLAAGPRVTLTAVGVGTSTVRVTASDPAGLTASQSFAVTVARANRPPLAAGSLPPVGLSEPGATHTVDVSGGFVDPDGDALTYTASSSSPGVVTARAAGSRVTLTAVGEGAAVVQVTATDPAGLSAAQTFAVSVGGANQAPSAVGVLPAVSLPEPGATRSVEVSGAFVDPDGDALTYTASSSSPGVVTARAAGSRVTLTAVGEGAAVVQVTATDPAGLSAAQTFAVSVGGANQAPSAVGVLPAVSLPEPGATRSVEVSGAFVDPDGDALTYTASSSAPDVVTVVTAGGRATLTAVAPGRAAIEVTATDPGGLRASQTFAARVTAPFTDDPVRPGETPVRAVHFTELRARIDVLRGEAGLGRFAWTDPVLRAGATRVRLAHLLELREALGQAYRAAGRAAPRWTDPAPARGATPIRAAHLNELRAAVLALE